MTKEERELAITYLEEMKESYIEGVGYERHPLPEYYAIENAIKALEQEPKSEWEKDHAILKAYSDGANDAIDKIRAEIEQLPIAFTSSFEMKQNCLDILDKYEGESEG